MKSDVTFRVGLAVFISGILVAAMWGVALFPSLYGFARPDRSSGTAKSLLRSIDGLDQDGDVDVPREELTDAPMGFSLGEDEDGLSAEPASAGDPGRQAKRSGNSSVRSDENADD